ncbi:fungal-specific transcription factor domain-containing protein [Flagelloscypha sp. PMI_526]|nr:fungal-specific transcription factor domain-containing protein [Flagelloscypha sp. PMI_526]
MSQGLVACAECKRTKLKCDKKIPCSTCVRRDCSGLCPTGVLVSRKESKTFLVEGSSGRRAQREITRLRERNLQLEEGLAAAHSHHSVDIHPLLSETLQKGAQDDPEVDKVAEVLGTLAVGEAGELRYFGPSAAAGAEDTPILSPSVASPQTDIDHTLEVLSAQVRLGTSLNMDDFVSSVLKDLPERMRAWSLCENFYEHYPIYTDPIPREELFQVYLSPIYKYFEDFRSDQTIPIPLAAFRPHRCAVIFFAFALGTWLDLNQEHYWIEANQYFQIGLSCLSMQSVFYSPEMASIQALFLLAYFKELRGAPSASTLSPSWMILSLACKIAQGLGLHRDPAKWSSDYTIIQRRRWLYWELVSVETLHSLGTGRPPSGRQSYVDTELPDDPGQADAQGQPLQGFFRCKHEAVRDCYLNVVETLLAATPPKYETIIELDRKVREKEIPAHLNRILVDAENGSSHKSSLTAPQFMHTCILGVARSVVLLSIHRTHLTQALQDPSGNPLKSRYAPSFLASYRAASWIVKSFHASQKQFPILFPRLWHPWTAVLTAAMVLGSIAIHSPSSIIGTGPLEELRVASSMFEEAARRTVSHRTKSGAKIVQKILARAEGAHIQHLSGDMGMVQPYFSIPPINYGDDELAIFGGQTRLLPIPSQQTTPQPQQSSSYFGDSNSSSSSPGLLEEIHPSLVDFLTTAPMTPVASSITIQEMEAYSFGSLPTAPHFQNPHPIPPQIHSWAPNPVPTPQRQYDFADSSCHSTTGPQFPDQFENYLDAPIPVDRGSEPASLTPWQEFMNQHSLLE